MLRSGRFALPITLLLWIAFTGLLPAAADDGIPDNCEQHGTYQRVNLFPRYEFQNSRFVLVDWSTGENVLVLEEGLAADSFWIIGWSPDCRYLTAAVYASRDYVVWDTVNGGRVGSVPHARAIDWSPDSGFALVQSDAGAYLWNFAANVQTRITTVFDDITNRNLSGHRWDMAAGTVTVTLVNGQIFRFDLTTGQEAPIPPLNYDGSSPPLLAINGQELTCQAVDSTRLIPTFLPDERRVVLLSNKEVVQTLLENVDATYFESSGWSPDCRYLAFALGNQRVTDTYVWNIAENRRVGVFPDAHIIPHPISWGPAGDVLLIETRSGAYLWQMAGDVKILLTKGVSVDNYSYWSRAAIHNFLSMEWDTARGQLLAVPVAADNGVAAYDLHTGQQVGFFGVGNRRGPVRFSRLGDTDWLLVYSTGPYNRPDPRYGIAIWNQATGISYQLPYYGRPYMRLGSGDVAISPDSRYLVQVVDAYRSSTLYVWDLQHITSSGAPAYRHFLPHRGYSIHFVDATTIDMGSGYSRWNIITGERIAASPLITPGDAAPVAVSVANSPGEFSRSYRSTSDTCPYPDGAYYRPLTPYFDPASRRLALVDSAGAEVVILQSSFIDTPDSFQWSPTCHYLLAEVGMFPGHWSSPVNTVVWDTVTGDMVQVLERGVSLRWSPLTDSALIIYGWYSGLWHIPQAPIQIESLGSPSGRTYWDYGRDQILVGGYGGVRAFDMTTGALRQIYTHPNEGPTRFVFSDDRSLIAVYTDSGSFGYEYGGLTVWNLNTLENFPIDVNGRADEVQFSPDNRYLVIRGVVLRVWDLQNLPELYYDRQPIYRLPIPNGMKWQFVDQTIIEVRYLDYVRYWDISTGEQVTR